MRVVRNNDRRCTNTITHVYDFVRLAYTRRTVTCYSSLSASCFLLLDIVHRDSRGDFLPCRMYALKLHFGYDRRFAHAVSHFNEIETTLKKNIRIYLSLRWQDAGVIRIRSLTMAEQFERERQKLYERITAIAGIKSTLCGSQRLRVHPLSSSTVTSCRHVNLHPKKETSTCSPSPRSFRSRPTASYFETRNFLFPWVAQDQREFLELMPGKGVPDF